MDHDLHRLVSFSEKASAMGLNPSTTVLDFIPMPIAEAPTQVRISLCSASVQDDAEALIYMKRLRFVDGIPVILEHRYLRSQYCPDLMPEELAGSLYRLISEKYALKIYRAEECIRAINLNQQEAKVLQIARRTAAIEVTGTASVSDGSPLWWERTVFRGDVFEFRNVLGEDSAGTPPHGVIMNAQFCPAYGGERSRQ
jgi:GntR family transcriptional regulator